VEKAIHLLVLGLALVVACPAQSGAGAGLSQTTVPLPSPPAARPVEPASQEHITAGAGESLDSPSETLPAVAKETTELESQIQNALGKDPTLIHDSVRVAVSEEAVELTGNVATSRERLTATRIAQSYAGSKRVVSRITVAASPQESATPEKKNVSGSQRQLRR